MRLAKPQRPQRRGLRLALLVVDLVGGQEHRLAGAAQDPRGRLVPGGGADDGIDHQDHGVGGLHGHRSLIGDQLLQALGVGFPAAGVLHHEAPPAPQRVVGHPVPGHAGQILHHRLPPPKNPVDQSRLAHIRTPDYGQHRWRRGHLLGLLD